MSYRAAIIGLGQIGMGYDYKCNDDSLIITHASAYHYHRAFDLIGASDISSCRCREFERKYRLPSFNSINELMERLKPDIVSISTPTQSHYDVFNQIIPYAPKAIIMEKPSADTVEQSLNMVSIAKSKGISLLVNYVRRFEPGTNRLKHMIKEGLIGDVYKGNAWYCKGLKNNGSHFIDLLMYLLGHVKHIKVINKGRVIYNNDPEPDCVLTFNDTEVVFRSVRSECFSMSDFTLIGTRGFVSYSKGKILYKTARPDTQYDGYTTLTDEYCIIETDFDRYQYHVLNGLHEHLSSKNELKSNGVTAAETLKIVQQVIDMR